jgi:hypothetical protein
METAIQTEGWRPIPSLPGYSASSLGRIVRTVPGRRTYPGRILKATPNEDGYLTVTPFVNGVRHNCRVHCLVAEAFLGPVPEGMEVNHKNTIRFINRSDNLEYMTRGGNVKHSWDSGRSILPQQKGRAKLTPVQVLDIKRLLLLRIPYSRLATQFNVSKPCIAFIAQGRTWKNYQLAEA